jgi:ribosomal silencing factor RsfS
VDAEATASLRKLVQAGADAKRALDRARAEQRASGFALEVAAFEGAADQAVGVIDEVRRSTLAISEQVAQRCRLKLTGEELAEATLRAHAEWVLLDVPGADARRIVILKVNRDKKTCVTVYDRAASPAAIENLDGDLLTWSVPGTIPFQILVSFGKNSAWFLENARFVRYPHEKAAGFSKACAGAVTCTKPRVTAKTLEATCECTPPPGQRLLPSDLAKTGRYAWEGSRVIAEP